MVLITTCHGPVGSCLTDPTELESQHLRRCCQLSTFLVLLEEACRCAVALSALLSLASLSLYWTKGTKLVGLSTWTRLAKSALYSIIKA